MTRMMRGTVDCCITCDYVVNKCKCFSRKIIESIGTKTISRKEFRAGIVGLYYGA